MNTILDTIQGVGGISALIVAMNIGLTQIYKKSVCNKYLPYLNLATSLGLAFLLLGLQNIPVTVTVGIIASLTSMGLFSSVKTVVQG